MFIGINMLMIGGNLPLVIYFGVRKCFIVSKYYFKKAKFYFNHGPRILFVKFGLLSKPKNVNKIEPE